MRSSDAAYAPRSAVVSTPDGFAVYRDGRDARTPAVETFPFGRADEAFALATKLDAEKPKRWWRRGC